jgi:hypothetical protein
MKLSTCAKAAKALFFSLNRFFFFACIVFMCVGPVEANVPPGEVTFSWQANPPEDNVIGYRLYYGAYSRFNPNGSVKSNFSYRYYIDFADQVRCDAYSDGISCKLLTTEELQCENLYGEVPKCSVPDLHGHLYFALTAYNAQSESSFTPELNLTVNAEGLAAVQQAATMLLKEK